MGHKQRRKRVSTKATRRNHPRPVYGVLVNGRPFVVLVDDDDCPICRRDSMPAWRSWEPDVECIPPLGCVSDDDLSSDAEEADLAGPAPSGHHLYAPGGSRDRLQGTQ